MRGTVEVLKDHNDPNSPSHFCAIKTKIWCTHSTTFTHIPFDFSIERKGKFEFKLWTSLNSNKHLKSASSLTWLWRRSLSFLKGPYRLFSLFWFLNNSLPPLLSCSHAHAHAHTVKVSDYGSTHCIRQGDTCRLDVMHLCCDLFHIYKLGQTVISPEDQITVD